MSAARYRDRLYTIVQRHRVAAVSLSRKTSPVIGYTTARSDQPWKAKAARAFRHAADQRLRADREDAVFPVKRWACVNPWDAPKNGKQRIADVDWKVVRT